MGRSVKKSVYMSGSVPERGLALAEFHVSHLEVPLRLAYTDTLLSFISLRKKRGNKTVQTFTR